MIKFSKLESSIIIILFGFIFSPQAGAQTMTNGSFNIEAGNLNSIAGESTGSNYNLNITSGENAPGLYEGNNYKLRAGFQYLTTKKGFSLSLSNSRIDFGTLTPTNPVIRETTLTVSNSSAQSYQVTASENHQLQAAKTGAIIPDTTCDGGTCSETTATEWSNTLTYGFGFRCDAISIKLSGTNSPSCIENDNSFMETSYFKQFADVSRKEKAQKIIGGGKGPNQKAVISYKINIASSQATGIYTNSITYIATPNF